MKKLNRMLVPFLPLLLTACSDHDSEPMPETAGQVRIQLQLAGDDDSGIHDVAAWRFEHGLLKEVLLPVSGNAETALLFSPEVRRGNFYLMANTSGLEAIRELTTGVTREEAFTAMTARGEELSSLGLLMTGRMVLDKEPSGASAVTMQRAAARIDLFTPESGVEVRKVSIRGLQERGYVLPQEAVAMPEDGGTLDFSRDYADAPLANTRECLLYVPEQTAAEGALVEIEAQLNGGWHRLQVRLPRQLSRNHIYTVQVRGKGAELSASVLYEGWESGGVSGTTPQPSALVDVDSSVLDKDVRISAGRDTVFFPYTGGSWQLVLQTGPDAVLQVEGRVPEVAVTVVDGAARVEIDGGLRKPGTSEELLWVNVSEGGVHTGRVALVFEASPVKLGGMLVLDEAGVCDWGRYVDGELGTVEIPAGKVLKVETPPDAAWLKADAVAGDATVRRYRIVGGWRPNDPTADGRTQEARLVISDDDGSHREEYVVRRLNWGLPVVKLGDTWWTKYNLRGDVRSFEDQITCNEDPAAGRDLLQLLQTLPEDSLLLLMGDQYQAGFYQGLPLRHDGEAYYHEDMQPSGKNFGLLDPTLMAPDGYQIPAYEDYAWLSANDNQNLGGVGSRTYTNRYGDPIAVSIAERDVDFLGHHYGVVSFYGFESGGNRWVLFGLGHQWTNTPGKIARMHLLLATYGNPDQTWVMEGYEAADRPGQNWLKFTPQNHIKTRTIRCVKTPVEYMY